MMKLKIKFSFVLLAVVVTGLFSSCSKKSASDNLLSKVPADTEVVFVGNLKTIMQSAGGDINGAKFTLPNWVNQFGDKDELEETLMQCEELGVNLETIAFFGEVEGNGIMILALENKKKFVELLDNAFEKERDNVYRNWNQSIIVDGSYAYWNLSDNDTKALAREIDSAKKKSFADTPFGKYVAGGNVGSLSFQLTRNILDGEYVPQVANDWICFRGDFVGSEAIADFQWFDEDGNKKEFDFLQEIGINTSAKISSKALDYLGKNDMLAYAISLKDIDWDKYWDFWSDLLVSTGEVSYEDMRSLGVVKDYLSQIDGTIAIGLGVNNGIKSFKRISKGKDVMNELCATIVIETQEGKSDKILSDITGLLHFIGIDFIERENSITLRIPDVGTFYLKSFGDVLVLSNHAIQKGGGSPAVNSIQFTDYSGAMAVALTKDSKLMRDMGFNNDLALSLGINMEDMSGKVVLKIAGNGDGILAELVALVWDIAERSDELERLFGIEPKYNSYYRDEDYSGYWDY